MYVNQIISRKYLPSYHSVIYYTYTNYKVINLSVHTHYLENFKKI